MEKQTGSYKLKSPHIDLKVMKGLKDNALIKIIHTRSNHPALLLLPIVIFLEGQYGSKGATTN